MKSIIATGSIALALLLGGCGSGGGDAGNSTGAAAGPIEQIAAPNGGDWTQTVTATPEGGFRMGNPEAPVKLVEYASLSCPTCARFSAEGAEPLTSKYVKSGQVSWEYRPYLLFPTDLGPSMLVQCQGPTPAFKLIEQIYADQENWLGRVRSLPPAQLEALGSMPPAQQSETLVRAAGFDTFFRQRGMPESRIKSCLGDAAAMDRMAGVTSRASNEEGVTGTPTFFINGQVVPNVATWEGLEPALRGAIG